MIKILITVLLFSIEVLLYYKFNRIIAYPARVLLYSYFIYWYYSARKDTLNITDKLFLWSCAILIVSPVPDYIWNSVLGKVIEVVLLMLSQHLIIVIWQKEGAKISFSNKYNSFTKILIPYIIVPLLFFFLVIVPTFQTIPIILSAIYLLQMVYIATLSAFLPFPEKSKWYIALAMGLLIISSGANASRVYVITYTWDYAAVRLTAILFRFFLLIGLLYREKDESSSF